MYTFLIQSFYKISLKQGYIVENEKKSYFNYQFYLIVLTLIIGWDELCLGGFQATLIG